jgi:hypothetical protein
VVALAGAAAATWWLWAHPRLQVANPLRVPVTVAWGNGPAQLLKPGGYLELRVSRADSLPLRWEVADGAAGARPVRHRVLRFPAGPLAPLYVETTPAFDDGAYFTPVVTNASSQPITLVANAGLAVGGARVEQPCRCKLAPGTRARAVGLYRLYGNSSLRARRADGRTATFESLGAEVDRRSGTVRLRFTDAAFR